MSDKRTVATDALETLGTIISENEKRDAIHLAVVPVVAQQRLEPGDHVDHTGSKRGPHVGIVDPFLTSPVRQGERFWLVIYPRQITSLRHVWTHPAFPEEEVTCVPALGAEEAEKRLRVITESWDGPGYDAFLELATTGSAGDEDYRWQIDGQYIYSYGRDACGEINPEVWTLVETVTGKKVKHRPEYFTCSC